VIVLRKTLADQRRALVGWALGMAALVLLYTSFYPSVKANAAKLNQYIQTLPDAVRNMIGRGGDFSSPTGYLQSEIFSIMGPLLLMILAIGAGARAIAGEEEIGTLDLLLANPIARRRVVAEKFWAMVAGTAGVGVVMWAAITVFGPLFGVHVGLVNLAETVLSAVLLAVGFGTGALAVGCLRGKRGLAIAVVVSVAVVTYLLNVLAPSVHAVRSLQKLSPFYYYIENDPLRNGLDPVHALVLVSIAAAGLGLALLAFERRDLPTH
jgi:ABC-2 type transport system permease protein